MVFNIEDLMIKEKKISDINKKPSANSFCSSKIVEFCNRTDLHGYKYIVMKDLNRFERSCWALAVMVSLVIGIYFVVTAYRWYARNPIVTVIESTQAAIWDVPFPAVTICDLNLISRKAAQNFARDVKRPENVSEGLVFDAVRYAPLLHASYTIPVEHKRVLYILQSILDFNDISVDDFFKKLSPVSTCNQLIERCMWKNTLYRCNKLFRSVFTVQNMCCTFNYFAVHNTTDNDQ
ncbi:hypothetical protein evm_014867 [Chilo suppressalis]|nr:hypothetical protein evm_014867 [Chilo suppressalis]